MIECKSPHWRLQKIMRKVFFIFILALAAPIYAANVVEEIVARVGNEIITKSDLEHEQKRLYDELSRRYQGSELDEQYGQQKKALLEFIVNQKLLEQRATELHLNVDDDVNAAIKRLREESNIPNDQALQEALKQEGSTITELREDFRRRIIQQRILWNYVQGKVNITEDEIKNYYEQHKNEFMTTPKTKIRRYTITDENVSKEELKTEADNILAELRAGKEMINGASFPHLKVDDPVEYTKEDIDPKIASVLDATKVGEYSEPVEITSGWSILRVEERKEPELIAMEEARSKIYNQLLQSRAEKYQKSFMEDLRKQNYVVINQSPS
jgi:peptidyl-prolyl cis-trans isomerase SurA